MSRCLTKQNCKNYLQLLQLIQVFLFAWWIHGQVLLFDSVRGCGAQMYDLVFVLFWIAIACMGLGCCMCCCAFVLVAKGRD